MMFLEGKVVEVDCKRYLQMRNHLNRNYVVLMPMLAAFLAFCGSAVSAADSIEPDPRLAQKVTIDCTGVRFHTALERISAKTGVVINAGKGSADWKVRDIPVFVCARDMPLGALLKTIADTNHLLLSRNRVDDLVTYRIWRDLKREKELSAFDETRQAAALAAASYDWDTFSMVKDLPESVFPADSKRDDDNNRIKAISRMISELGPEVRDRVLSGETVVLGMSNMPEYIKPHLMSALEAFQKSKEAMATRDGQEAPKSFKEQINKCFARIAFDNRRNSIPDQVSVEVWTDNGYVTADCSDYYGMLKKNDESFPSRPVVPRPVFEADSLPASYAKIKFAQEVLNESREGEPKFFETKIKVETLGEGEQPLYSDLLRLISKAIGYSIIAEGNAARLHCAAWSQTEQLKGMFGREISVREVMELATGLNKIDWYVDETNKLIVGRDTEWTERLKALVPEKLLVQLDEKMQGDGFEIDDLQPLAGLTGDQAREWISYCPEFPSLQWLARPALDLAGESPSKLYFALDTKGKELAKSGTAVPLSGIDANWLCHLLRTQISSLTQNMYMNGEMFFGKVSPDMMRVDALMDPDALPELFLRLKKEDLPKDLGADKHWYHIYVEGSEGSDFTFSYRVPGVFPVKLEDSKPNK